MGSNGWLRGEAGKRDRRMMALRTQSKNQDGIVLGVRSRHEAGFTSHEQGKKCALNGHFLGGSQSRQDTHSSGVSDHCLPSIIIVSRLNSFF